MSLRTSNSRWVAPDLKHWLIVHIVLPIAPYLLVSVFRWGTFFAVEEDRFNAWTILNPSELALSLALISFFILHSLRSTYRILDNEEKKAEADSATAWTSVLLFAFIGLFLVIECFKVLFLYDDNSDRIICALRFFYWLVFIVMPFLIAHAIRVQSSFKLKAKLI